VVEVSVVGVGEKSDDVDERYFCGGEPWLLCVASQHGNCFWRVFGLSVKFKGVFSHLRAKKICVALCICGQKKIAGLGAKVRELR
jgi:hypothetical protein